METLEGTTSSIFDRINHLEEYNIAKEISDKDLNWQDLKINS